MDIQIKESDLRTRFSGQDAHVYSPRGKEHREQIW